MTCSRRSFSPEDGEVERESRLRSLLCSLRERSLSCPRRHVLYTRPTTAGGAFPSSRAAFLHLTHRVLPHPLKWPPGHVLCLPGLLALCTSDFPWQAGHGKGDLPRWALTSLQAAASISGNDAAA